MNRPSEKMTTGPFMLNPCKSSVGPFIFILLVALSNPVYAQNCGAAGKEIRAIQSNAFDDYPALNDLKQGLLLMLYGRGSADCTEELYSLAMEGKEFITMFNETYNLVLSDSIDDRFSAMDKANALEEKVASMEKRVNIGASAQDVATSSKNALTDFFKNQGQINEREGGLANRTRDKIAYYRLATIAYEAADENILAANTRLKWKTHEEKYSADMETANNLFSEAETLMENAWDLSGSIPNKIDAYVKAMEALELYKVALSFYKFHNEDEKIQVTEAKIEEAKKILKTLKKTLILYFSVLIIVLIGIALYLLNRLLAWREDTYEYYLGNELIKVKGVA